MSKVLVAYFSASGVTKKAAEQVAAAVGADLYEIVPKERYSAADLDYMNSKSRSSREMNDPDARPELAGEIPDLSAYDAVILGYPIWWGVAPRIVQTFVEGCNLNGKTLVAFCTSGGSGFGRSDAALHQATGKDVTWLKGKQLNRPGEAEVRKWLGNVL